MTRRRVAVADRKPGRKVRAASVRPAAPLVDAIPTQYRGHLLRSRLEARWAACLDQAGIPWSYEPEVFEVGRLGLYRPDFRLDALGPGAWLEVKGAHWIGFDKTRAMARRLGSAALVLVGTQHGICWQVPARGLPDGAEVHVGRCGCGLAAVGVPGLRGSSGRIRCRGCGGWAVPARALGW